MEKQEYYGPKNAVIAEFMGYGIDGAYSIEGKAFGMYNMEFHDNWTWIYPVITKILQLNINHPDYKLWIDEIHAALWKLSLEKTYSAILNFIGWYKTYTNVNTIMDEFMQDDEDYTRWVFKDGWNKLMPVAHRLAITSTDKFEFEKRTNIMLGEHGMYVKTQDYMGVLDDIAKTIRARVK